MINILKQIYIYASLNIIDNKKCIECTGVEKLIILNKLTIKISKNKIKTKSTNDNIFWKRENKK